MKYIITLIILLILPLTAAFAYSGQGSAKPVNGDELNDMKYDREFLISQRDSFIGEHGDLPVSEVVLKGLKRTRPSVILAETGIGRGDRLSTFDPHAFINRLKKKTIFSEIDVAYSVNGENAVIEVTIVEKWTLIPIPMVTANSHGTAYGLYVLESNFMGYGKFLFTGGTFSSGGGTLMIGYIDPSVAGTKFRSSIFISYKNEIYQHGDVDYNINSEYRGKEFKSRLDWGYNFSDRLRWFLSGGYQQCTVDHGYDRTFNAPDDSRSWITGTIGRYENLVHYEYLYYGPYIEVNCYRYIPYDKRYSGYTVSTYRFDYSVRFIGYNRLSLSSSGSAGQRPEVFEQVLGGKPGGRTLPADIITADNFINYTVTYEYPFLRFGWGVITLQGFWEQGGFERDHNGMQGYYGPGAGVLVYLKRLAIPAMGLNVARNLDTARTEFSFSIGMTF